MTEYKDVRSLLAAARKYAKGRGLGLEQTLEATLQELGFKRGRKYPFATVPEFLDAVYTYATDVDWCSEFDSFMEALGLPRRKQYKATVRVTIEIPNMTLYATDDDQARRVIPKRSLRFQARRALGDSDNGLVTEILSVEATGEYL